MDVQETLARLERHEGVFPRAAVREAVAHRDEIIPPLLKVLEAMARDPQAFTSDPERMIHIYPMFLLAQFRETRAYSLLVQIFSTPGEVPFELAEDVVTEDLGSMLASVSDGDMSGMTSLVEDENANEYVRAAALEGLLTLVACGKRRRDEVMSYFQGLFRTLSSTYSFVWDYLASCCAALYPEEVVEDVRRVYQQGLVNPGFIRWEGIEMALQAGREAAMKTLKERYRLTGDVEEEMGWWACFEENKEKWGSVKIRFPPPAPNPRPKVGRNELCPCGSGKKFKRCCGRPKV